MGMSEQEWLDIFGDNLKYLLEYKNITRQELAKITGLTEASISRYINKKLMPSVEAIINIADALDETYEDLIYFEDNIL